MIAPRLRPGDEIRVIAPSRSLSIVRQDVHHHALSYLREKGYHVTFGQRSLEKDDFDSSSVESRAADLHEAFLDENVRLIFSCIGGFNSNQLLCHLDFDLIRSHPKMLCGYSDVTALLHAIYARTGLVTYHGPHFSTFGFDRNREYTWQRFVECVSSDNPFDVLPSAQAGKYHILQGGTAEGKILGGNLCTLNLLQGTPFMPDLNGKILLLEDDNIMGEYFRFEFDRNLESLLQLPGAQNIRGVVFGHVFPMMTFPIGGAIRICAEGDTPIITILGH